MVVCCIVCYECGKSMKGSNPSKIDYRMVTFGNRLRPLCGPCYEDFRHDERKN